MKCDLQGLVRVATAKHTCRSDFSPTLAPRTSTKALEWNGGLKPALQQFVTPA